MLGLDDAYDMEKKYDRLTATSETSIDVELSNGGSIRKENMMTGYREMSQFLPNDVEMMLASYASAARARKMTDVPKYSWQSYKGRRKAFGSGKDKTIVKYAKSNVIH